MTDVDCPTCGQPAGKPCVSSGGGPTGGSHAARAKAHHKAAQDALPSEIHVGDQRYVLRRYTGKSGGHGWIRERTDGWPSSEVGAEARRLLDEIARLQAEIEENRDLDAEYMHGLRIQQWAEEDAQNG